MHCTGCCCASSEVVAASLQTCNNAQPSSCSRCCTRQGARVLEPVRRSKAHQVLPYMCTYKHGAQGCASKVCQAHMSRECALRNFGHAWSMPHVTVQRALCNLIGCAWQGHAPPHICQHLHSPHSFVPMGLSYRGYSPMPIWSAYQVPTQCQTSRLITSLRPARTCLFTARLVQKDSKLSGRDHVGTPSPTSS